MSFVSVPTSERRSLRRPVLIAVGLATAWLILAILKLVPQRRPATAAGALALAAAGAEFITGVMLLVPSTRRCGAIISLALSLAFLAATFAPPAVLDSIEQRCGCLGPSLEASIAVRRALAAGLALWSVITMNELGSRHLERASARSEPEAIS
ncbi:MAG: hypothetical protein FJ293_10145 [Planctomycetes bacterium]|nr:hypothetical protein [Planctomycetota bacterium]